MLVWASDSLVVIFLPEIIQINLIVMAEKKTTMAS